MWEENVEAVRRAAAAGNNKDPSILDSLLHPDAVWEGRNRSLEAAGISE